MFVERKVWIQKAIGGGGGGGVGWGNNAQRCPRRVGLVSRPAPGWEGVLCAHKTIVRGLSKGSLWIWRNPLLLSR